MADEDLAKVEETTKTADQVRRERDEAKALYQDYRERGAEIARQFNDAQQAEAKIAVPIASAVHAVEDGAFVEAVIWVPKRVEKPAAAV